MLGLTVYYKARPPLLQAPLIRRDPMGGRAQSSGRDVYGPRGRFTAFVKVASSGSRVVSGERRRHRKELSL